MENGKKQSRGFGLIETLIACAILVIISGALLTINVVITRDIVFAKGRSVAFNLAAEAIESTRQIRDSNLIDQQESTNWNTFVCSPQNPYLSSPVASATSLYKINAAADPNCFGTTQRIFLTQDTSLAGENIVIGGITYNRKIHFLNSRIDPKIYSSDGTTDITDSNAIRMVVDISWNQNNTNNHIQVSELLTNWKRGL